MEVQERVREARGQVSAQGGMSELRALIHSAAEISCGCGHASHGLGNCGAWSCPCQADYGIIAPLAIDTQAS